MKEFLKSLGWKQWLCLVGIAWGLLLLWSSTTYQGARVYCAINPCYQASGDQCVIDRAQETTISYEPLEEPPGGWQDKDALLFSSFEPRSRRIVEKHTFAKLWNTACEIVTGPRSFDLR